MGWGALATWLRGHGATVGLMLIAALPVVATQARAQIGSARYAEIVVVADTGRVLSASNPDEPRIPASLTKMMTLFMAFEGLRDRRITLDQPVPVSEHCAAMEPTKLGLVPGVTRLTVHDAILGMVTLSANDAACAIGELLAGGNEARFAEMMTLRARGLGMTHTLFRNASGLPTPQNLSTVRDIATLARHLIHDFPADYRYFATRSFVFHGRTIEGHDDLLASYPGADGIKTGYTIASGSNLATSAVRGGVRLIGVVVGAAHAPERDANMRALLDAGFREVGVLPEAEHGPQLVTTAEAATMPHPNPPPAAPPAWIVRVGAFSNLPAARRAAAEAQRLAGAGTPQVIPVGTRDHPLWRAEVTGLDEGDATDACRELARHHLACAPSRA
jgi:D-alanyl-D-alanine carboxypeptidase